jgi:hypothetical protein
MSAPDLSVIIPNLDGPTVDRAVGSVFAPGRELHALDGTAVEVLVVGRDRPGRLTGRQDIRHVETGPLLPGAARNRGIAEARGAILLFLDGDCEAAPGWLAAHLECQAEGRTVVGGAVLWDEDRYWTLADNLAMFHEFSVRSAAGVRPYLPTLNLGVARRAIEGAGLMDPQLRCGEDLDWTIRLAAAGHPAYFEPAAAVWHRPPRTSMRSLWRHHRRTGRWMPGVRRRHVAVFGAPAWLYHRPLLALLGPLAATWATWRIFRVGGAGRDHPATAPAVWLAKLAWVVGALQPVRLPHVERTQAADTADDRLE